MKAAALNGEILSKDTVIAIVRDGSITESDAALLPLYLKRTGDAESWIAGRAIDSQRVNSRLLKKALRLSAAGNVETALNVNAATITDNYWFRPAGSALSYDEIRYRFNHFDKLALRGDPDSFNLPYSRTPELTNIGSFEKCWRLDGGRWWIVKRGTVLERFSELFICKLGQALGFPMAAYEAEDGAIKSPDFTGGASVNFEAAEGIVGDEEDYGYNLNAFITLRGRAMRSGDSALPSEFTRSGDSALPGEFTRSGESALPSEFTRFDEPALPFEMAIPGELAEQYLQIIYMDALCFNMDRHTKNYGVLRDAESGEILRMAPNFDNNIALFALGVPKDIGRANDKLISLFLDLLKADCRALSIVKNFPAPTEPMIEECLRQIPIDIDECLRQTTGDTGKKTVTDFIMNGSGRIQNFIFGGSKPDCTNTKRVCNFAQNHVGRGDPDAPI